MALQLINIGGQANDGTGDSIRDAFNKTNSNFGEVYTQLDVYNNIFSYVDTGTNASFATTLSEILSEYAGFTATLALFQSDLNTNAQDVAAFRTQISSFEGSATSSYNNLVLLVNNTLTSFGSIITNLNSSLTNAVSDYNSKITLLNNSTASLAQSITTLDSKFNTSLTNAVSSFTNSITLLNNSTASLASQLSTLTASYNNTTGTVQTFAAITATVNTVAAKYGVTLNTNGHIAGFQILDSSAGTSSFIIQADKFAVETAGGTFTPLSVVGNNVYISGILNGNTGTFSGALSAATGSFAGSLSAATGTFGTVTVDSLGSISSGQTAYNNGSGFWLGGDGKFSVGNSSGNNIRWDGSALTISAPVTATSLNVGSSPAVSITLSGATMTGSGAAINNDGTFALGNAYGNIAYDGSSIYLNGNVVDYGSIVSNAATTFQQNTFSVPNGVWTSSTFYMSHPGYVGFISNVVFNYSGSSCSYQVDLGWDGDYIYAGLSGNFYSSAGPATIGLIANTYLSQGFHKVHVYANHTCATGDHQAQVLILRSYR